MLLLVSRNIDLKPFVPGGSEEFDSLRSRFDCAERHSFPVPFCPSMSRPTPACQRGPEEAPGSRRLSAHVLVPAGSSRVGVPRRRRRHGSQSPGDLFACHEAPIYRFLLPVAAAKRGQECYRFQSALFFFLRVDTGGAWLDRVRRHRSGKASVASLSLIQSRPHIVVFTRILFTFASTTYP